MPSNPDSTSIEVLDDVLRRSPQDDPALISRLTELRSLLRRDAKSQAEKDRLISEYEEAYRKLTSPANRIGVLLQILESGRALVGLGDSEYVAEIDPKTVPSELVVGARALLNEAYAVIGTLPAAESGVIAKVTEVREDGRIRVGSEMPGSEGRIVFRSSTLEATSVAVGDEVRLEPQGRVAVEHFAKKEVRDYFFEEVPELPWEKVGGQRHAIQLIKDTIEHPLLYPEIYAKFDKKPIKGILLYGPPGCGKTLIGKATAYNLTREYAKRVGHEVKEYFMYVSGPKILNMWLGETERMVREIFGVARERAKEGRLVFLFVDEAESVLRTRSSGRWLNISNTVVPQFCAELDGLVALDNVVLMLTSNRPDYIDPAVLRPERIDRKVKVGRPDKQASLQILDIYLHAGIPLEPDLTEKFGGEVDCARAELIEKTVDHLWRDTKESEFLRVHLKSGATETLHWRDLVSGALLKSIVDRAKDLAIKRAIQEPNVPHGVSAEDLKASVDAEYKENEIFPKSDTMDDWLKLLDYEPENVASVKPIGRDRSADRAGKSIL
jgi:proteasome-associated ATPase